MTFGPWARSAAALRLKEVQALLVLGALAWVEG
jgi:hypothetical protein